MADFKVLTGTIYQVSRQQTLDPDKYYVKIALDEAFINMSNYDAVQGEPVLLGGVFPEDPTDQNSKLQHGIWCEVKAMSSGHFRTYGPPSIDDWVVVFQFGEEAWCFPMFGTFPKEQQQEISQGKHVSRFLAY